MLFTGTIQLMGEQLFTGQFLQWKYQSGCVYPDAVRQRAVQYAVLENIRPAETTCYLG